MNGDGGCVPPPLLLLLLLLFLVDVKEAVDGGDPTGSDVRAGGGVRRWSRGAAAEEDDDGDDEEKEKGKETARLFVAPPLFLFIHRFRSVAAFCLFCLLDNRLSLWWMSADAPEQSTSATEETHCTCLV